MMRRPFLLIAALGALVTIAGLTLSIWGYMAASDERALDARCPNTPIVAKSCFNADGSIEVIYPGQTAIFEVPIPEDLAQRKILQWR